MRLKQFEEFEDPEIILKILKGEIDLYEIIIRRYNPYLFKIGRSYGFVQSDIEDLMQETFINAYTNLEKFENRASLKTWLVRIMLNLCYHKKEKFGFKNELATGTIDYNIEYNNVTPMFSQNNSSTGNAVVNNELKHVLESALLEIPENYKIVFTLRELNGMSTKETAEVLGISESNIKIRLKRAKSLLRTRIQKMYSPDEIFEFNLIYCNRIVDNVLTRLQKNNPSRRFMPIQNLQHKFFNWFGKKSGNFENHNR